MCAGAVTSLPYVDPAFGGNPIDTTPSDKSIEAVFFERSRVYAQMRSMNCDANHVVQSVRDLGGRCCADPQQMLRHAPPA